MQGAAHANHGGDNGSRTSTLSRLPVYQPKTNVVPCDQRALAQEFSGIILPFSRGQLIDASRCTKEAVKGWQTADTAPSLLSAFNMVQHLAPVRGWMLAKCGYGSDPDFMEGQMRTAAYAALYQALHDKGPAGEAFRAELGRMQQGG